jgi:hypothetical protein
MPDYDNNPQSYILPMFPKGIYLDAQTQTTPKLADDGGHFSPTILTIPTINSRFFKSASSQKNLDQD